MVRHAWAAAYIIAAFLLLGGLYLTIRQDVTRAPSEPHPVSFNLSLSAPYPGEELPTFGALQGDTVTLLIKSDRGGDAHLHGYELDADLLPGGQVRLTFLADRAGLFPIHLHEAGGAMRHVATLEIKPR